MILVTGGTGLVGSHLLYRLVKEVEDVRAIYRTEDAKNKVKEVFSYYTKMPEKYFLKIDWVKADITNIPSMLPVFKGVTQVYHVAALVSFNPKDYREMRKVNIHGTAIMVNLSIDAKVQKFCYVSSIATLGTDPNKNFINEDNEWNDNERNNGYAITKYGGEMEVWRASQEGVDVVVVNPGVILGPSFWQKGSSKLFSEVAKGFSFYTEGVTGFVGVEDVVKIMIQLMQHTSTNERFVLVAENKSYKSVLTSIAKAMNVKPPSKKISVFMSEIFWRWELIKSFITRTPPRLSKLEAKSLHSKSFYKNKKIKNHLNFTFEPIEEVIKKTATSFLLHNLG